MSNELKSLFGGFSPGLDRLMRRAAEAETLSSRVRGLLPAELQPHLLSASRREDELVLIADSAAWATRLRYCGSELCAALATHADPAPRRVRVKVRGPA